MLIWNSDGVLIHGTTQNRFDGQQMTTVGMAMYRNSWVTWEATVTPQGWYVTIYTSTGNRGSVQGATFNIVLEVVMAIKHLA